MYQIFCLLLIGASSCAMEKRKEPEQGQQVCEVAKKARVQELSAFEQIPTDVKSIILNLLVTAEGSTNVEKLKNAAKNIRNFMIINKTMKRQYLDNVAVNGFIIQELAQRYTRGNMIEAATALHTAAGGRWLRERIMQMPAEHRKAVLLLQYAAYLGDITPISYLLTVVPDIVNEELNLRSPVLITTAQNGKIAFVERLLATPGIDVNRQSKEGDTALIAAAGFGHTAIVERLLAMPGIDVNLQARRGVTALIEAAFGGYAAIVERLLAVPGINIHLQDKYGASALMRAVYAGNIETINLLLARPDIDVNVQSPNGFTALRAAAHSGHANIVERLLAMPGIHVNARDRNGGTALSTAIESNSPNKDEIIALLRARGAQ